jgi:hypothetical protein
MLDIVIKPRDFPGKRIGMEKAAAIERERHSVAAADVLHHHLQGAVAVPPIELSFALLGRHGSAKDPSAGIGNDVVEARPPFLGNLCDQFGYRTVSPDCDRTPIHEEQQRPICLNGEAANRPALITLLVAPGGRIVAEQPPGGNVCPIELLLDWVPERVLPRLASVVGDEFRGASTGWLGLDWLGLDWLGLD